LATKEEILAQIKALQDEADRMDDGEEYDVEIWNEKGEGARLPKGQTTRWLKTKFPDLFDPDPDPNADANGEPDSESGKSGKVRRNVSGGNANASGHPATQTRGGYFAKRPPGK